MSREMSCIEEHWKKSKRAGSRLILVVTFTKKEFDLRVKVKVAVGGQLSAIKKTIRRFLFTDFQKMKNQIYRGRNFLPSKNYRKF